MRTLSSNGSKPNYLFGLLPHYFKQNDTYKDINDKGLLERYLEIFCNEVDQEVVNPYIEGLLSVTDAEALGNINIANINNLLIHIAETFGNPPSIGTDNQYKALLRHIWEILQCKGTTKSLSLYLALYGYKIKNLSESGITLHQYDQVPIKGVYDTGLTYDEGFTFYSGYDLAITDYPGTGTKNPSQEWLNLLKEAISQFISPVFAQLNSITYSTT